MDPWAERADEDDLYDWENEPTIDQIKELQSKIESWDPVSDIGHIHRNRLALILSSYLQSLNLERNEEWMRL